MNILFITADQWRGDCLSAAGHPVVKTPHLDALAADGVRFARHYANCCPCAPSRASIHTGQYLMNHRVGTNGTPLESRFTNWALEMRRAGHDPVLFGYTDTALDPRDFAPRDRRLATYEEILPGIRPIVNLREDPEAWANWLETLGYDLPERLFDLYTTKQAGALEWEDGGPAPAPLAIPAEHHDTHFMTDAVIDYIRGQRGRPWVAHLSLLRPHPPFIAPAPYNTLYAPEDVPAFTRHESPQVEAEQHAWLAQALSPDYAGPEGGSFRAPANARELRRITASYYGLMSEVDDNLGRLFEALKVRGEWDRTLIVFSTDHGEQMGDHWLMSKLGFFEQSFHIPLIIRDPRERADAARGASVTAFTENVDLMPTLLDWLGLPVPGQCDGCSLLPLVETASAPAGWRSHAHHEYDFRNVLNPAREAALGLTQHQCALAVLRGERYKYVHFAGLPPLFYDLAEDPGELENRAGDPLYADRVLDHAQAMLSWRMTHAPRGLTETTATPDGPVTRQSPRYPC